MTYTEQHRTCIERIEQLRAKLRDRERRIRLARALLECAEAEVNDNPANGPGAPHVPGLCEIRDALAALRKPLPKGRKGKT